MEKSQSRVISKSTSSKLTPAETPDQTMETTEVPGTSETKEHRR